MYFLCGQYSGVTKQRVLSKKSFESCFSKMFNKELDPSDSGHSSMNSLLSSMAIAKVLDLAYENFAMAIRNDWEKQRDLFLCNTWIFR